MSGNSARRSSAQRLGGVLERLTRQSGHLAPTPDYGSWILGRVSDSPRRRRIRIQVVLTGFVVVANLIGVGVALLVVTVTFPVPSVFDDRVAWITFLLAPTYIAAALSVGVVWGTNRVMNDVRWSIEDREPTLDDQRNTFFAPGRLTRVLLILWFGGAVLLTVLYGLANTGYIPKVLLGVSFSGIVVSGSCYLFTEFALRPVAARALEVGPPPRRFAPGIMGRTLLVWAVGSGVPVLGILLAGVLTLTLRNLTPTQFAVAVVVLAVFALVFGFILMWLLSWFTATPVRVVRAALHRVERGELDTDVVVFDGTELGQLQRGFNRMVHGLRERERVRDLFGRHVGREVAALAEREQPELGGEERHAAVIFVDIIGSTKMANSRPPKEIVAILNRFFEVVVDEVEKHHGMVNKFEGDAVLAVFGAPFALENPDQEALSAARAMSARLRDEVTECEAGIGVSSGVVVAGNVGAKERFEYTVIGGPVNAAARLCELAKVVPGRLIATADTVERAGEPESGHWEFGDTVTLRGYDEPTQLAVPRS
ncbi:adenylate/guanylate cyclase domain-containing protein [Mycobacterium vicinigordonae]|uniref:Adenylate/guanylate cyclase domain-containing protein n=1 Tax=Mycobacterium vicinigordonae TaxID=1719132 RepID=A0A7D6DZP4_9MYCO|nr:adenylate/guanylate cyclase domain-containing protein [Mycobacterium vicinigordonae]QLL07589.1 adenylate/guanylate cyclase domain-containing protein [Mycobacterium vicinigordonae]